MIESLNNCFHKLHDCVLEDIILYYSEIPEFELQSLRVVRDVELSGVFDSEQLEDLTDLLRLLRADLHTAVVDDLVRSGRHQHVLNGQALGLRCRYDLLHTHSDYQGQKLDHQAPARTHRAPGASPPAVQLRLEHVEGHLHVVPGIVRCHDRVPIHPRREHHEHARAVPEERHRVVPVRQVHRTIAVHGVVQVLREPAGPPVERLREILEHLPLELVDLRHQGLLQLLLVVAALLGIEAHVGAYTDDDPAFAGLFIRDVRVSVPFRYYAEHALADAVDMAVVYPVIFRFGDLGCEIGQQPIHHLR